MKIESIIRRDGGTVVTLGCMVYQFLPDESGRHVAEVSDPDHIGQLLAIREGYRIVHGEPAPVPVVDNSATLGILTPGDLGLPVQDDGEGGSDTDPGTDTDADGEDAGGDGEGEGGDDGQDDAGDDTSDTEPAELDREALAVEFEKKFGNRPHGRWSAERIRDELKSA